MNNNNNNNNNFNNNFGNYNNNSFLSNFNNVQEGLSNTLNNFKKVGSMIGKSSNIITWTVILVLFFTLILL